MLLFFQISLVVLFLLIAIWIVWDTISVGISPLSSSRKARQAMLNIVASSDSKTIIDLGSGFGRLVLSCAYRFPDRRIIGYERSWIPWCISVCLKHILGLKNVKVHRRDFLKSDLSGTPVLLCYLFPRGMQALKKKLYSENNEVEMIVSNTFTLPGVKQDREIRLNDIYRTPIYVYKNFG